MPQFRLRMCEVTKEALRIAAFKNKRSQNDEAFMRLEQTLEADGFMEMARESLEEEARV